MASSGKLAGVLQRLHSTSSQPSPPLRHCPIVGDGCAGPPYPSMRIDQASASARSASRTAFFGGFPCVHAAATTPAQRLNLSLRSFHPDVSVFPERVVGSTCALSFSRIARRSLALRPAHSRCHQFVTR